MGWELGSAPNNRPYWGMNGEWVRGGGLLTAALFRRSNANEGNNELIPHCSHVLWGVCVWGGGG